MFFFSIKLLNKNQKFHLSNMLSENPNWVIDNFATEEYNITFLTDSFYSYSFSNEKSLCIYETLSPIKIENGNLLNILSSELSILSYVILNINDKNIYMSRKFYAGRPFYYYLDYDKKFFCCSSHIRLLSAADIPIIENKKILPEFLAYRFVIPPNSLFKDILVLEAGEQIKLSFCGNSIQFEDSSKFMPYNLDQSNFPIKYLTTQIGEYLESDIVEISQKVDSRLIMLLSGGLDSSILAKIALKHNLIKAFFRV